MLLRNRLLPVVRILSPLVAATLLLPATAFAQETITVGPAVTPTAPAQPPAGQIQAQTPGTQTQTTGGTATSPPQAQTQQWAQPAGAPVMTPGSINMQPQIQVLVQPQIQVSAQPKGDAAPQGKADANINTNTSPAVTTNTQPHVVAQPYVPPQSHHPYARPYAPPPRVVTRVVSQPGQTKQYKVLKPLPRRKGLMITGWVVFGVSYLLTASNAADLYDRCPGMNNPGRCRDLATDMFIPVAGPFLAMQHTKYATDDYSLAVAGSLQSAGLLMAIIGTGMYVRDGQRNRIINEYGLRVAKNARLAPSSPALGGGGLTFRARF